MSIRRLVAISVAVAVVVLLLVTPFRRWAIDLVRWVADRGASAAIVYAVIYVGAAVTLLPGSALTLGAGFVYGVGWGTVIVLPAAWTASLAAFLIARRYMHGAVQRRVEGHARFAAIDRAVARAGFKITLLLRLSPLVPYGLLNYALGATSVRARDYALATAIGMLPGTVLYVYLGSLITTATALGRSEDRSWLYWLGGAVTIGVAVALTIIGRRELGRELAEVSA